MFSMHSFNLLFSVSLLVVPLEPVFSLLHTFFFYDLSHASFQSEQNNQSSSILSVIWHFGKKSCQRNRPVLPEIKLHYKNSLIIHVCDWYSSSELARQNAVCRCAHPRDFMFLLEFGSSPIWATVILNAVLQTHAFFSIIAKQHLQYISTWWKFNGLEIILFSRCSNYI